MRSLHFAFALLALSCGGIAVFDDGAGGEGNAASGTSKGTNASSSTTKTTTATNGSTKGSSVVTTPVSCPQLEAARAAAFQEAVRCDTCIDFDPCGIASVTDKCGCVVPATSTTLAAASEQAYAAWVGAGCGPLDCEAPCQKSGISFCAPVGTGTGCAGVCAFGDQ